MAKPMLAMIAAAAVLLAPAANAQTIPNPGTTCPAGTHYATVRHNIVKPGQWHMFEQAVAAHNHWYAAHQNTSRTTLARVIGRSGDTAILSVTEAVTITQYSGTPQPAHDAAFAAFTASYRASSEMKDEARICMP